VADAVGQNVEYIRHQATGVLVPSGNAAAMAEAVIDLLHDPLRAQAMGQASAIFMREHFSWDRLAETVERAYGDGSPR